MRSDAMIPVTCDRCNEEQLFEATATARGWDDRDINSALREAYWTTDGDTDLCPGCTEELAAYTPENSQEPDAILAAYAAERAGTLHKED